jgi:mannan endo-1,4-beta-mannosidase
VLRYRLLTVTAVVIAAVAVVLAVTHARPQLGQASHPPAAHTSLAAPKPASFLGVYEEGPPGSYQPVTQFAQAAGKQPNLVGYYSGWLQGFETPFAQTVTKHAAVTIMQWDPEHASIAGIAAGSYDEYLRTFADSVRRFGRPVVIGFGHEMNATWYSWGYGHVRPATFVAAWRHIVTVFRDQGADNVTWLWTINADRPGTGPVKQWWPGAKYVDWVGIDGYYVRPSDNFTTVFAATIAHVGFTHKPVLLSETAVGPAAGQSAKIPNLFAGLHQFGAIGLVWFDIEQHDGLYHQDWRIENSPSAQAAFRRGVSSLTLARLSAG